MELDISNTAQVEDKIEKPSQLEIAIEAPQEEGHNRQERNQRDLEIKMKTQWLLCSLVITENG